MARRMLARGSRGLQVQALQESLVCLAINPGPIDGVFGPKTEAAVPKPAVKKAAPKKTTVVGAAADATQAIVAATKKGAAQP